MGNKVEKLYADYCKKYANSKNFEKTTKELLGELKMRLTSEGEFVSKFVEISYSQESIPLICYIFDRINNWNLDSGQRTPIFNSDEKLRRKNHNIEHFYPQTPEDDMKVDSETMEVVNNVGNLLAISFRTNSKLGNKSPEKKLALLKGDLAREINNLTYVQEFIRKYEAVIPKWNEKVINARAKEIAEEAYRKFWKIG